MTAVQHQNQGQHAGETGKIGDPSRIILARHGETLFNLGNRLQGWCDSPLTAAGETHARDLSQRLLASGLTVDTVAYADTGRHRHTAEIVLGSFPKTRRLETPALRECSFGRFEGHTLEEAMTSLSAEADAFDGVSLPGDDGFDMLHLLQRLAEVTARSPWPSESPTEVAARALNELNALTSLSRQGLTLAITSGITMLAVLDRLGIVITEFNRGVPNGAAITLVRESNHWKFDAFV